METALEGQGNNLTVAEGTRVQANGLGGTALLVSYGKEHNVQLDGSAVALGEGGIAARFDFGDNEMGNNVEYRGSWIRTATKYMEDDDGHVTTVHVNHAALPSELEGSLVESFNVTGLLAGEEAAIYIGDNALVEQINILSGAKIYGDIVSKWNPMDDRIQADEYKLERDTLYTQLTFGQTQGTNGAFEDDNAFSMTLYGSIQGDGINMSHKAGRLEVLGTVQVAELENHGTLALYSVDEDGYAATVGNFVNAGNATLETGFVADGSVTKVRGNSALLYGTLAMRPMADFYASDRVITLDAPFEFEHIDIELSDVVLASSSSPTLTFELQET